MRATHDVVIVAGYHDTTWHIKLATLGWKLRYGLRVHPYKFGTKDGPETYERHWQEFEDFLSGLGRAAVLGTSFGVSIADRAIIEHPDQVPCIIDVSGPHRITDLNQHTVDSRYQMLRPSLGAYDIKDLPLEQVMTIRPEQDEVINPEHVWLEGANNLTVGAKHHMTGIVGAMAFRSNEIAEFIHHHMEVAA